MTIPPNPKKIISSIVSRYDQVISLTGIKFSSEIISLNAFKTRSLHSLFKTFFEFRYKSAKNGDTVSVACINPTNWRDGNEVMAEINKNIHHVPIIQVKAITLFCLLHKSKNKTNSRIKLESPG